MMKTETWLLPQIPDTAVQLVDRTIHQQDKNEGSVKKRGGGLGIYVHNELCRVIDRHCSFDFDVLSITCRPFCSLWELIVGIVTAVYISPDTNVSMTLNILLTIINKHQHAHPSGFKCLIILLMFLPLEVKTALHWLHTAQWSSFFGRPSNRYPFLIPISTDDSTVIGLISTERKSWDWQSGVQWTT